MATQLQRQRIRPMWNGGLRRGKVRDTMTQYLAERPELAEEIFRLLEESRAVNGPPVPLPPHVRIPFDFERR
jgi:hypothetical protein